MEDAFQRLICHAGMAVAKGTSGTVHVAGKPPERKDFAGSKKIIDIPERHPYTILHYWQNCLG